MASPSTTHDRPGRLAIASTIFGEARHEILAIAAEQPHALGVSPRNDPEAVVLDLVKSGHHACEIVARGIDG
jgi:hypothetical protein